MSPTPLQIKTKAIQRLLKEKSLYAQEVADQERVLKDMRDNKHDEYAIKKHEEVLAESKRMIPELEKKIKSHKESLAEFLKSYSGDEDVSIASSLV